MNKKDVRWLLAAVPAVILIAAIAVILVNTAGKRQTPTVKSTVPSVVENTSAAPTAPVSPASSGTGISFIPGTNSFVAAEQIPTMNETWWVMPYIDYTIPTFDASALTEAPDSASTPGQEVVQGDTTAFDPYASGEATQNPEDSGEATQHSASSEGIQGSEQAAASTQGGAAVSTTSAHPVPQTTTAAGPAPQTTTAGRPATPATTVAPAPQTTAAVTEPAGTAAPETWGAWSNPAWSWGEWKVIKAATVTAEGSEERTGTRTLERFSNYGRKETKDESKKETRVVPKIQEGWSAWKETSRTYGNWQWGAWTVVNPATCNGKGTEERTGTRVVTIIESRSSNTGKTEKREAEPEAEIKTESRDIPQLSHKYTDKVVAATHNSQGYTLHTCSLCNHSFKDSFTDMLAETWGEWVWSAWSEPEWNWGPWVVTKAATYEEYGMEERVGTRSPIRTGTRTSSTGKTESNTETKDQRKTEYRYTPKLDEGWGPWTAGDWSSPDWTWGEWRITQAPTYDDYGVEERTGTRTLTRTVTRSAQSGKTESRTESKTEKKTERRNTPKLEDTWGEWVFGEWDDPEWTYGEWKVTKAPTATTPGVETRALYRTLTRTETRTSASGRTETRQGTRFESKNETREIPKLTESTTKAP